MVEFNTGINLNCILWKFIKNRLPINGNKKFENKKVCCNWDSNPRRRSENQKP